MTSVSVMVRAGWLIVLIEAGCSLPKVDPQKTSCSVQSDCVAGYTCDGTVCVPTATDGGSEGFSAQPDGGDLGSPLVDGFSGTCLASADAAPNIQQVYLSTSIPTGTGGTIVDGTYFLTTRTVYAGGGSYPGIAREILRIDGQQMFFVDRQEGGSSAPDSSSWARYVLSPAVPPSGPQIHWDVFPCPAYNEPSQSHANQTPVPTLTATSTQLVLYYGSQANHSLTYQKQ